MSFLPADNIPLSCSICPRKDDFSDVSHLLTHVASKGHLSNLFKMKIRASSNVQDRRLVEEYDEWYENFGLDELMSERLQQKEKKAGGRSAGNASRRGSGATTTASSRSTPASMLNARRATRQLRDSVLNPQLGRSFKPEPQSRSATPASIYSIDPSAVNPRMYAAQMHQQHQPSWPNTPYAGTPMKRESLSPMSDASFDDDFIEPMGPPPRRGRGRRVPSESGSVFTDDGTELGETTTDPSKLKGVLWQGMAMFDSATPEMKRKRNQKKDYSVIEQLMATSEFVEPTEMIFDTRNGFSFKRAREITGNPDLDEDEEPLSGEITPEPEPVKKRPLKRPRQALTERNVNVGRVTRRSAALAAAGRHPFGSSRPASRGPYFDERLEQDNDLLTYGPPKPKKRTGLSIHRDNTGPDITFPEHMPLNRLTAPLNNPFDPAEVPVQSRQSSFHQDQFGRPHQRQQSFSYRVGTGFRPHSVSSGTPTSNYASFGQLNAQPMYPQHSALHNFMQSGVSAISGLNRCVAASSQSQQQQQSFGHGHQGSFPPQQVNNANGSHNPWDVFGFGGQDSIPGYNFDTNLHQPEPPNPLFFSSNQPTPREDDDATLSPPASEH